jgi:ribonuclease BN (tRNA processing enzyme)
VDCGTKCSQALFELGRPITDIRNYLITHSHADHIGGLEEVALMGRYAAKRKPLMLITETYQHILWDMSLRGGCAHNEEDAGDILGFTDFFDIARPVLLPSFKRMAFVNTLGALNLKTMRTKHIPDSSSGWESSFWSCGLLIDDRVLFTSDTRFDPDLLDEFDPDYRLEAIFHDTQYFKGGVHASIDELATLSAERRAQLHLVHYGDNWEQFEEAVTRHGFAGLARPQTWYDFT